MGHARFSVRINQIKSNAAVSGPLSRRLYPRTVCLLLLSLDSYLVGCTREFSACLLLSLGSYLVGCV